MSAAVSSICRRRAMQRRHLRGLQCANARRRSTHAACRSMNASARSSSLSPSPPPSPYTPRSRQRLVISTRQCLRAFTRPPAAATSASHRRSSAASTPSPPARDSAAKSSAESSCLGLAASYSSSAASTGAAALALCLAARLALPSRRAPVPVLFFSVLFSGTTAAADAAVAFVLGLFAASSTVGFSISFVGWVSASVSLSISVAVSVCDGRGEGEPGVAEVVAAASASAGVATAARRSSTLAGAALPSAEPFVSSARSEGRVSAAAASPADAS
mmetsp:Transcript_3972/g.14047  ORF Transcript_3972/g.14047 Transcript_3972/m.14047 type:complete len:274 (+) Transcript_3972:1369-2190(+)